MNFDMLSMEVIRWAEKRQIIGKASASTQALKTGSELGELFDEIIKGNKDKQAMELGDVLVCLIILADMLDLNITQSLGLAYSKINGRSGKSLDNGAFVKDADSA